MNRQHLSADEFYTRVFIYRLELRFAQQRYEREVQALLQLKVVYGGRVPPSVWEKQRRRVLGARTRMFVREAMLKALLEVLNN